MVFAARMMGLAHQLAKWLAQRLVSHLFAKMGLVLTVVSNVQRVVV